MFKKKRYLWMFLLLGAVLLFVSACDSGTEGDDAESASAQTYNPGTYTSERTGHSGTVTVEVTFSETEIEEISIDQTETEGIGDAAIENIRENILERQTLAVDAVSGATESSNTIIEAVADCVEQAEGDVEALMAEGETTTSDEEIEETADVVIIGGGGAGLAAANSAAESGSSVILIEKSMILGGNTLRSGAGYNTYNPETQSNVEMSSSLLEELEGYLEDDPEDYGDFAPTFEELQNQIEDYIDSGETDVLFDSPELHAIHTYIGGRRTDRDGNEISSDYELTTTLTENSLPTLEWLEEIGLEFGDGASTILGALWPRSHSIGSSTGIGIIDPLEENALELGVEIMMETEAEKLIVENGQVIGVEAITSDGTPVTLHANQGVILATGGFGANPEMRQEYNTYWDDIPQEMGTTNIPDATGDGILIAEELDVQLVGMGFAQLMPSSHPETGSLGGGVWGSAESQVFVNKDGERFVNEYSERDTLAQAALEQEDQLFYIISDANTAGVPEDGRTLWGDDVETLIETESIYRADTLEELAMQLDMDEDALTNEIEKYNGFIEDGEDPEFGKSNFGTPIETGPFYATPRSPSVHHTMGGVAIDTSTRVLDINDEPIPGLFAAGEVTGGIHAGNRLGGNAITDALTFGKIAGESVSKE